MKKVLIITAAAALMVAGCSPSNNSANESAGAQAKQNADAYKDNISQEAKQAKSAIDAQANAAKAQADAQAKAVQDGANAALNSDGLIKAKVRAAILNNSTDLNNPASVSANPNAPTNLNVDVSNGRVTLKGTVATSAARMDCEQRAMKVAGVTSVVNQLEIKANQ